MDLKRKLLDYQHYYNHHRTHSSLNGRAPTKTKDESIAKVCHFRWQAHCHGLFELPVAPELSIRHGHLRQPRPHHLVVRFPRPEYRNGLDAADLVEPNDAAEARLYQQRVGVAERDVLGGEEDDVAAGSRSRRPRRRHVAPPPLAGTSAIRAPRSPAARSSRRRP